MKTYYHNPRCSKSRQGLVLLEGSNIKFDVKEYLKVPLKEKEILELFKKLNKEPSEFIRKKETAYKELNLKDKELTLKEWANIIVNNPILLERPILETQKKAIIGRPPEELLSIL